ncbi:MAG: ABC transporter substrate-binding protein, partial [Acidobacteriota bacterium]
MVRSANSTCLLATVALLVVAFSTLAGCSDSVDQSAVSDLPPTPRRGGTLVIATKNDLMSVNPVVVAVDASTQSVLDRLFLSLFEELPDFAEHPPTFGPQIAKQWSWSEDRLILRVELRDDLFWSDGVPLTSEDVVWTWQVQTSSEISWNQAGSKESILAVEALEDHLVRVEFRQQTDSPLWDLNEGAILPKHVWSRLPLSRWRHEADWFVDHLVTSGPYRLERWDRQQQVILTRNERYFDPELPRIDRLVFKQVPLEFNQVGQLLSGQLDFVVNVPVEEAGEAERVGDVALVPYPAGQYNFICWNLENPLFSDVQVRRALTMAIDREAIVDSVLFGRAVVSNSPILSSVWAYNRDLEPWPYDPERSRKLLAELGWHDTDGDAVLDRQGQPFEFELLTNAGSRPRVDATVMIQEQLRRLGIDVKVRSLEFNSLSELVLRHDFESVLLGWSVDTSLDQTSIFHSNSIEDGSNFGSYSNPELDRLIEMSNSELDSERRAEVLAR